MVVIVAIAGLALGFIVILLISLTSPRQRDSSGTEGNGSARSLAHGWISRLEADELARLLAMLFGELKYEVQDTRVGKGVVDLFAVNPTPITGGRIYVRGIAHPPLGTVGEDEVRVALDTARAEMAGKALVATGGVFSPEARAAAEGAPIELLDGATLLTLIKKHLPPIAVARRV